MLESEKISILQFANLVFMFTIGSSILIISTPIVLEAKQDAWISAIIAIIFGMVLIYLYSSLAKNFPQLTLVKISEQILGPFFGKLISFAFFTFTFLLTSLVLNNMGSFMQTQILIETPILVLNTFFILVVIFAVSLGLEVIARCGEVFLPWVLFLCIFLVLFNFRSIDMKNILPIFDSGVKPILRGSVSFISIPFLELVTFFMVIPTVNDIKKAQKGFLIGGLTGGIVLFSVLILSILVLGVSVTERQMYPTYILGKKIGGNIFQRIEVIVAIIWIFTMFFKSVILFYASVKCIAQIFNVEDYRFLLFPLGMITIFLSLIAYPNVPYFLQIITRSWPLYAFTYGFLLPVFLHLMYFLKKKLKKN